jgi:hypothetical protein
MQDMIRLLWLTATELCLWLLTTSTSSLLIDANHESRRSCNLWVVRGRKDGERSSRVKTDGGAVEVCFTAMLDHGRTVEMGRGFGFGLGLDLGVLIIGNGWL